MIEIHNSLTGRKEPLRTIEPGHVRMYVCGITVYDFCHVGHARSNVAFDVVRRYLRYRGYRVTHVRNITDIDDKIIARAAENAEPYQALTARFIRAMHEDFAALGIETPEYEPRATDYIPQIIDMTSTLIDKGYAYVARNGDVMYSVSQFADYGRLSGRKLADLRAGARVEVDIAKRDPLDFVLWKQAKPGEPEPKIDFTGKAEVGKCPKCGGKVFDTEAGYLCENLQREAKSCKFKIGKTILEQPIEPAQAQKILATSKSDLLEKFISKAGKPFPAFLIMDKKGKITFDFPPREE